MASPTVLGVGTATWFGNTVRATNRVVTSCIRPYTVGGTVTIRGFAGGTLVKNETELINALVGGDKIIIGSGTIFITQSLVIPSNVTLCGCGHNDSTILKAAPGLNAEILTVNGVNNVIIRDIKFDGASAQQTSAADCVTVINSTEVCIEKCCFRDPKTNHLTVSACNKMWIDNCVFDTTTDLASNSLEFNGISECITVKCCLFLSLANIGILMQDTPSEFIITGCIFDTIASTALFSIGDYHIIDANVFKNCDLGVDVDSGNDAHVSNNQFSTITNEAICLGASASRPAATGNTINGATIGIQSSTNGKVIGNQITGTSGVPITNLVAGARLFVGTNRPQAPGNDAITIGASTSAPQVAECSGALVNMNAALGTTINTYADQIFVTGNGANILVAALNLNSAGHVICVRFAGGVPFQLDFEDATGGISSSVLGFGAGTTRAYAIWDGFEWNFINTF